MSKQSLRPYSEDFVTRMKDFAILQLSPSQVADRMGLVGDERMDFLEDIANILHPISIEYHLALGRGLKDLDLSLSMSATEGDPKALKLAYEVKYKNENDKLKNELFGL